jgi:hypothetical protein
MIGERAGDFKKMKDSNIIYIPPESKPYQKYTIHGVLTVRCVAPDIWKDRKADIAERPAVYLYLDTGLFPSYSRVYPEKQRIITLKEKMASMHDNVSDEDNGKYKFIVDGTEILVHSNIVNSAMEAPLTDTGMSESAKKTVVLQEEKVEPFKVFVRFLYTLDVHETDMWIHAVDLLRLADKFVEKMLHYMCEWYLCWYIQVSSPVA